MSRPAADAGSVCGSAAASFGLASAATPPSISVDPELRKCLAEVNTLLAIHVAAWMKKRGKSLQPKLNDEQRKQLEECFELMDADGSGAIDADELGAAFKLLGLDVSKADISAMLAEVDEDGSGEVEYPEFIEIMTSTLSKLANKKEEEGEGGNQVPFALLATAYRRKRIMEGLISGDREVMAQVTSIAEQASRRAAEEAQRQQQLLSQQGPGRQRQHSSLTSNVSTPKGTLDGNRPNIFRSTGSSADGSVEQQRHHRSHASSGTGSDADPAAANSTAATLAAAGEARLRHVSAHAGVSSGLLRALQHVKSLCSSSNRSSSSSSSASIINSPTGSSCGSQRNSLAVGAAAAGGSGCAAAAAGGGGGEAVVEEGFDLLPVQAVAGVLSLDEQRQLVNILRGKTRKRLEALAAAAAAAPAAAAAGHVSTSGSNHNRSSSSSGNLCLAATGSAAGSANGGRSMGSSSGGGAAGTQAAVKPDGGASGDGGGLEGLVGAKQHLTSQRMLRLLTQSVEPPKFALTSPVQRAATGGSCCSSPAPAAGSDMQRGCRSACSSPAPHRPSMRQQLVLQERPGAVSCSSSSTAIGSQAVASTAPAAADEASPSAAAVTGGVAQRKGINFGDTQIYEFDAHTGVQWRTSNPAGRSSRGSNRSSDSGSSGHGLLGVHRSKSLGSLSQDGFGHFSAPAAAAAGGVPVGSGVLQRRFEVSVAKGTTGTKQGVFNNNSSSGASSKSLSHVGHSQSTHKRVTAAALQQLGTGCTLSQTLVAPRLGQQQQQQQPQQWLPVPQLPRLSGLVTPTSSIHRCTKSSQSAPCCDGGVANGNAAAIWAEGLPGLRRGHSIPQQQQQQRQK